MTIFGGVEAKRIWVVLDNLSVSVYANTLCGSAGLLRQFECAEVTDVTERRLDFELPVVDDDRYKSPALTDQRAMYIFLGNSGDTLVWAWEESSHNLRGLWIKAISSMYKRDLIDTVETGLH